MFNDKYKSCPKASPDTGEIHSNVISAVFQPRERYAGKSQEIASMSSKKGQTEGRHVLLVEDSTPLQTVYMQYLRQAGFNAVAVDTGKAAMEALSSKPAVVVLDLGLPDLDGMKILKHIETEGIPTSVVVITNNASLGTAVEAMRLGAFDYVVKPFNAERLATTVRNAAERSALETEITVYRKDIARDSFHGFIGSSLPMQAVYRIIESAASSRATVFIMGESGTGKEVCASAIHNASARSGKPFIAINCAAIPRDLMESEIFGHVKGAFTGATTDRAGAAELADGGTLFLDEICEMDIDLQAKLLRLIQSGTYQRVGSGKTQQADLRIVCATNRDPMAEVKAGRFREDLYYRLHVIPINLPPLRERGDDIMQIAEHFLRRYARDERRKFKSFAPDSIEAIKTHGWPGNVRELQNAIHNAVVLADAEELTAGMLPHWITARRPQIVKAPSGIPAAEDLRAPSAAAIPKHPTQIRPLWLVEKEAILAAIEICEGNVPRAAAFLEVGVSTLYRKRAEWEQQDPTQNRKAI
jgi:DNA-binding NtrC family response regulator